MRRAASSVTANIAEGFGRFHFKDKVRFYQQARGSAVELQDHMFLAQDLGYISKVKARELFALDTTITKGINDLIRSIKNKLNEET